MRGYFSVLESLYLLQNATFDTPYKFSGKEKDDETGYSYFGARYYDSDLSVWLSMDPKVHSNISSYVCFTNNPIIKIDPFGDDDYFNEHGKYLFTDTKNTNNIRIIQQKDWNTISKDYSTELKKSIANDKMIKKIEAKSGPIDAFFINTTNQNLFTAQNKAMKNIQKYYGEKAGIKDGKYLGLKEGWYSMATSENDGSGISITFGANGNYISELLVDENNMQNTLIHEDYHQKNHIGTSTEWTTDEGCSNHLDAYWSQISHKTWQKTTPDFQDLIIKNIGEYLGGIKDEKKRDTAVEKFEKKLGVTYKTIGGSSTYEKK